MPTPLTHGFVAIAAGKTFIWRKMPLRFFVLAGVCSALPDLDTMGLRFGVPYEHALGHRGFFHSLPFAALLSVIVVTAAFTTIKVFSRRWWGLCAFFFLTSVIVYLSYARSGSSGPRRAYYLTSLVLFVAALLSKPMAVTLPFVLLLIDWYPIERLTASTWRTSVWEKVPFLILAGLTALLNMLAASGGAVPFSYVPAHMRIMNAFCALVFYIRETIAPANLIPLYQLDRSLNYFGPRFIHCAILVLLITAVCVRDDNSLCPVPSPPAF